MTPTNSAGLNGFSARSLNGAFQSKSNLVYNDVYYLPLMGTWALKGIDGGYYIRGNKNRRYVEPMPEHLDGLFKKIGKIAKGVVKTGLKLAAPLAKTALNVALPGAGTALNMASSLLNKGGVKDAVSSAISAGKSAISDGKSAISLQAVEANNAIAKAETAFSTTALEAKIKTANNNAVQSIDSTKNALQKSIQANNKAVITSLDSVDKASKERLDKVASTLNRSLTEVNEKAATTEEATKMIQSIAEKTAAISAGTQAINREQSAVINTEAQKNENFRNQITTWGKYALIALAIVIAWFLMNKQKQPNY
jgi:hypothetical protein